MPQQRRLDLARLDAEARAASPAASARPRNSSTPSPATAPGRPVRYIRLPAAPNGSATNRSAVRPGTAQIAPRQPRPRNVKLPRNPSRNRLQPAVQNINPRVRRSAARSGRCRPDHLRHTARQRDVDRRLGRAVEVDRAGELGSTLGSPGRAAQLGSASPPQISNRTRTASRSASSLTRRKRL